MRRSTSPLAVFSCRALCSWRATPAARAGQPLFACAGCGSQWTPGTGWTPVDADGRVPAAVRACAAAFTSAPAAAAADTPGS